mgnify:CR=1 FL=1
MTPVGFEPTQLALVELESTPLDHSGKVSGDLCSGVHVHSHVCSDVQGCARRIASGGTCTHTMHNRAAMLQQLAHQAQRTVGQLQFAGRDGAGQPWLAANKGSAAPPGGERPSSAVIASV